MLSSGMSDVIGTNRRGLPFWLELKALDDWPARDTTFPLKSAFEKGQVSFLKSWQSYGWAAFVLLKVGSGRNAQWLLLRPRGISKELVEMTRDELINDASASLGLGQIVQFLEGL